MLFTTLFESKTIVGRVHRESAYPLTWLINAFLLRFVVLDPWVGLVYQPGQVLWERSPHRTETFPADLEHFSRGSCDCCVLKRLELFDENDFFANPGVCSSNSKLVILRLSRIQTTPDRKLVTLLRNAEILKVLVCFRWLWYTRFGYG